MRDFIRNIIRICNPVTWVKTVKGVKEIGSMKARDRYLSIFYTWVIHRLMKEYKIPDEKLSEYMRDWERDPDKILRDWDLGMFGLPDKIGYDITGEEDLQVPEKKTGKG